MHVRVMAAFSVPKSDSKKKRYEKLNCILLPTKKPDTDNILKVVCDALNGCAYHDDKQVVGAVIEKYYATEPGLYITIEAGDEDG